MLGLGLSVVPNPTRDRKLAWADLKAAQIDTGTTPWDFDATGLSASGTITRSSTAPTYNGSSYANCAISAADSGNAFARGQFNIAVQAGQYVRQRFALFLPTGFNAAVVGSMQISRLDPFPTLNNAQGLIHDKAANDWRLFVKDNSVDTDITGRFTISENSWHLIEVQTYLHALAGWARVYRDGALVASGSAVKTIYAADDGSGTRVTRFRCGLVAIGSAAQGALSLRVDAIDLDVA